MHARSECPKAVHKRGVSIVRCVRHGDWAVMIFSRYFKIFAERCLPGSLNAVRAGFGAVLKSHAPGSI